jgi:putative membrane-bound dehydrogenase-like protein
MVRVFLSLVLIAATVFTASAQEPGRPVKLLFLGDDGPHRPAERFRLLQPALARRQIDLVYTDKATSLDAKILAGYDGLVIYANQVTITPEQEKALLEFVESGKAFIPLHCASFCFLNSPRYIDLVGGQFSRHGTGVVETTQTHAEHPILKGFGGFKSWDETYVHAKHNDKDRTVLEVRDENGKPEPWTWVRTQGKGRIFYTAWGHDARTWGNPGFHNLVERGIRWAVGDDPAKSPPYPPQTNKKLQPFEYQDAKVPFYPSGTVWGKTAEPLARMQKPVEPAASIEHMVVPEGMHVALFAAEPQIYRPIAMNWDERGRLWIAETIDYPNERQPAGKGRDRIVICEDTDGDGKADKFTVFADQLSIPTSLTFARDGVIVTQAPETLFLKDTDGDDKADVREVLFTGWGAHDTHAGPSNLQYGFDGWIYGIVGYSGFKGIVGGEKHVFGNGFFRFRPDGSRLEFLRNTSNNSWGVGFTEEGILFGSTANGDPSVHLAIPNRFYEKVRGWSSSVLPSIADSPAIHPITDKVRQVDHHGHFTAAAGHALYTARTYPKDYWNKAAFVTEPTGHLIARFAIEPKGATFRARNQGNFLASDDEWTSPIMAEVGPDGQMWVIDWYNYIIQHNPTPPGFKTGSGNAYETPLRDKTHGRIVRVVSSAGTPSVNPGLNVERPGTLIAALKNDNLLWRKHAQRLLVERGKTDVVTDLVKLVEDRSVDAIGLNVAAIHALWTLHGLEAATTLESPAFLAMCGALTHPSAGVRRTALMTLPRNSLAMNALLTKPLLDPLLHDGDPQVRLALLLTLAETPPDELSKSGLGASLMAILQSQDIAADPILRDAAICACATHFGALLATLQRKAWPVDQVILPDPKILERAVEHYARNGPVDTIGALLDRLAAMPSPVRSSLLTGLARGWPTDAAPALSPVQIKTFESLLERPQSGDARHLATLAKLWKVDGLEKSFARIAAEFLKQLGDDKETDAQRIAAAQGLVEFRGNDPTLLRDLGEFLSPRTPPAIAKGVLEALGRSEVSSLGNNLAALAPTLTPAVRPTAVRILLTRREWTRALLDGLDKGAISMDSLSLDQKQSLLAHPTPSLAARAKVTFSKGGGLPNPDREKVLAELTPLTKEDGDAKLGKAVFMQHCAKCHRHGGDGAKIGPDLTGMAVHPRLHLLTEIIDPNRSVEGNFRQYIITTKAGRLLTGLLASESKTAIEVVDAEAKLHTLQRDDIDELRATSKSLMPEGFEKQIPAKELVHLLTFLTQRGKYLPLPLAKAATSVTTKGMFVREDANAERLIFPEWTPQTFAGVPFQLIDPQGDRVPNALVLRGPKGSLCADHPRSAALPCNSPAKAIHILGGIAGWAYPGGTKGSVSMIVRLHYADGSTEDHDLKNGEHIADYIRRVDVPDSRFAFALRGQQLRYLAIAPKRSDTIERIEFVKGTDETAPVVLAVTVETR